MMKTVFGKRVSWYLVAASLILLLQTALSYGLQREEFEPSPPPLAHFPYMLGSWGPGRDATLSRRALEMLEPDDTLSRQYDGPGGTSALDFFVAYYKSQRRLKLAHDPKVCLPGSGWIPVLSDVILVPVDGRPEPIEANRFVIAKGAERAVVLYWFQTYKRAITQDHSMRLYRIWDTITDNRTDMALIRIVAPVETDIEAATARAMSFARLAYPLIEHQFPPA
jgi:EpsI family protein